MANVNDDQDLPQNLPELKKQNAISDSNTATAKRKSGIQISDNENIVQKKTNTNSVISQAQPQSNLQNQPSFSQNQQPISSIVQNSLQQQQQSNNQLTSTQSIVQPQQQQSQNSQFQTPVHSKSQQNQIDNQQQNILQPKHDQQNLNFPAQQKTQTLSQDSINHLQLFPQISQTNSLGLDQLQPKFLIQQIGQEIIEHKNYNGLSAQTNQTSSNQPNNENNNYDEVPSRYYPYEQSFYDRQYELGEKYSNQDQKDSNQQLLSQSKKISKHFRNSSQLLRCPKQKQALEVNMFQSSKRQSLLFKTERLSSQISSKSFISHSENTENNNENQKLKSMIEKLFDKNRVRIFLRGLNREGSLIQSSYVQSFKPQWTLQYLLNQFQIDNQIYREMDVKEWLVRYYGDYEQQSFIEPDRNCNLNMLQISQRSALEIIIDLQQAARIHLGENFEDTQQNYDETGFVRADKLPTVTNNYVMIPSIETLRQARDISQITHVQNLRIMNKFGEINFLQPVNLVGLNLSELIEIKQNSIKLYNKTNSMLNNGETLNSPAVLKFYKFGISTVKDINDITEEEKQRFRKYIDQWVKRNKLYESYDYQFGGDLQVLISRFY